MERLEYALEFVGLGGHTEGTLREVESADDCVVALALEALPNLGDKLAEQCKRVGLLRAFVHLLDLEQQSGEHLGQVVLEFHLQSRRQNARNKDFYYCQQFCGRGTRVFEVLGRSNCVLYHGAAEVLEVDGARHDSSLVNSGLACHGTHHVENLADWVGLYTGKHIFSRHSKCARHLPSFSSRSMMLCRS